MQSEENATPDNTIPGRRVEEGDVVPTEDDAHAEELNTIVERPASQAAGTY